MSVTWRLVKAGRVVGTIELDEEQGRVRAAWPEDMPAEDRRSFEEGRESFREFGYSIKPRPWLAAWAEYWDTVLKLATPNDWWDTVESDYQPPEYPTVDEQGNPILY